MILDRKHMHDNTIVPAMIRFGADAEERFGDSDVVTTSVTVQPGKIMTGE